LKNTEAAEYLRELIKTGYCSANDRTALALGVLALEHQPEPQTDHPETPAEFMLKVKAVYDRNKPPSGGGLECNVCHWRTLDTTRTLCDSCGSFELAPVSDIGQVRP
jgi:hypothetical protein